MNDLNIVIEKKNYEIRKYKAKYMGLKNIEKKHLKELDSLKNDLYDLKADKFKIEKENNLFAYQIDEMSFEINRLRKELGIEKSKNIDSEYLSGEFFKKVS